MGQQQSCNACVSSSMALCVWPCNCYGPQSENQPDLMWNIDLYGRLARADAWAVIGPVNWYGPPSNVKLMFDRLVCMNGGNPRPDLIDKKDTLKAQALETLVRLECPPERLDPVCGVIGNPLSSVAIPFNCQPLMNFCVKPLEPLPNGKA